MSTRSPIGLLAATVAALTMLLAGFTGGSVAAQDDATVLLRAFACPDASPAEPFTECDSMIGATFTIEANGAETAESPVTIVADMGLGPGATLTVTAGADLTVTLLSGAPEGYVPAPGFDPFSANVDDLPQVGFGGESTGPGITFIAIPADDGGSDEGVGSDEDDSDTTTLPSTGTGPEAPSQAPIALLVIAALLAGAGAVTRRQRAA